MLSRSLSQNIFFFLKQSTLLKSFLQGVLSKLTSTVHIAAEICTLLQVKVVKTSVSFISIDFFTVSSRVFFDIFVLLFYSLPSKYTNPMGILYPPTIQVLHFLEILNIRLICKSPFPVTVFLANCKLEKL